MKVEIYSDGSARKNPGPGGYGTIVRYIDDDNNESIQEFSRGYKKTTNNRMELLGAIIGFESLTKKSQVTFTSDSKYVLNAFTEHWIETWIENDWRKSDGQPVKNKDLWLRLLEAMGPHEVNFVWVKGHNGHKYNERCDQLATMAADDPTNSEEFL